MVGFFEYTLAQRGISIGSVKQNGFKQHTGLDSSPDTYYKPSCYFIWISLAAGRKTGKRYAISQVII